MYKPLFCSPSLCSLCFSSSYFCHIVNLACNICFIYFGSHTQQQHSPVPSPYLSPLSCICIRNILNIVNEIYFKALLCIHTYCMLSSVYIFTVSIASTLLPVPRYSTVLLLHNFICFISTYLRKGF